MIRMTALLVIICFLTCPVGAMEFTAPTVPAAGEKYFPEGTESFTDGLWSIIKEVIRELQPSLAEAAGVCFSIIAIVVLISMLQGVDGLSQKVITLTGTIAISILLIKPSSSLIHLGVDTVEELGEYGKLLLPVMTAAMAAQGGTSTSAALYGGTTFFSSLLSTAITKFIIPLLYIYITLCIANSAIGEDILKNLRNFTKWLITWFLKIILYVFTGYISITGVIGGTADASAIKAAKLAISGAVPVVGGIISDASEAILVSAGVMKNAAGIYGLLSIIAVCVGPFMQVGIQYLLLKLTSAISSIFGNKSLVGAIHDFSGVMGFILAMLGTVSLLLLISTVCFMKGIA